MKFIVTKFSKPKSKKCYTNLFAHANNDDDNKKIYIQASIKNKSLKKYHENYIFIDPNPGFYIPCLRLLYGSYHYDKSKSVFPIDPNRLELFNIHLKQFHSFDNGDIYYFPTHSYGFHSTKWLHHVINTIEILLSTNKNIHVKFHPSDKKYERHAKIKSMFPNVNYLNSIDLENIKPYACIVDGGSICIKLALLGYPIFCIHKNINEFLCKYVACTNVLLLHEPLKESMFPSYRNFLIYICSFTFSYDEIRNGVVHRLMSNSELSNSL